MSASTISERPRSGARMSAERAVCCALFGMVMHGAALAQTPLADTVTWTVSAPSADAVKPGSRLTLTLHGAVADGWHVYAFEQQSGGPIPLRVALDPSEVAIADGAPAASPPTKLHDPAFGFDTQFYARDFSVTAPVRIAPGAAEGAQQIPVTVRFQSCNGPTCRPPKTVHLSAPVTVRKAE